MNKAIYTILLPAHKIFTYYFFCKSASSAAIEWNADIAHAHDLNTMYAAYLVKQKIGSLIVYDSHELWIHRNRVGRRATVEKQIDKLVEKRLIREADAIITVCDSIGEWLLNSYPEIPRPAILRNMPYALDETMMANEVSLKSRLGLADESKVLMYTGKITTGRGIEIGLESVSQTPDLHLVLLGYGESQYVKSIEQLITRLGIENRVHFCDAVPYPEVPAFINGADFALVYIEPVCLSYEYALPNKLFESIQAGVPIMASGLTEIKKLVEKTNVGACFNSAEELIDKLNHIDESQIAEWKVNIQTQKGLLNWQSEERILLQTYCDLVA